MLNISPCKHRCVVIENIVLVGELTTTCGLVIRLTDNTAGARAYQMLQNTSEDWLQVFCCCCCCLDSSDFRLISTVVNKQWMTSCWLLLPDTSFNYALSEYLKRSYGNHYIPSLRRDFFLFILCTLTASSGAHLFESSLSLFWPDIANSEPLPPPYYQNVYKGCHSDFNSSVFLLNKYNTTVTITILILVPVCITMVTFLIHRHQLINITAWSGYSISLWPIG